MVLETLWKPETLASLPPDAAHTLGGPEIPNRVLHQPQRAQAQDPLSPLTYEGRGALRQDLCAPADSLTRQAPGSLLRTAAVLLLWEKTSDLYSFHVI
jgi:hypothetical protein